MLELSLQKSFLMCSSAHCMVHLALQKATCQCQVYCALSVFYFSDNSLVLVFCYSSFLLYYIPTMVIVFQMKSLMDTRLLNLWASYVGINLTSYHLPPPPRDSFSVHNSGPQVENTKQKSPPQGIICILECQGINEKKM